MRAIVAIFSLFAMSCLPAGVAANEASVVLVARAVSVTNYPVPKSSIVIENGVFVVVLIVNRHAKEMTLPSRLEPEVIQRDDKLIVMYTYDEQSVRHEGKKYRMIPASSEFAPIKLRPGESMKIGEYVGIEHSKIRGKPVLFSFSTKGILSERLGFTSLELETEMTMYEGRLKKDEAVK